MAIQKGKDEEALGTIANTVSKLDVAMECRTERPHEFLAH